MDFFDNADRNPDFRNPEETRPSPMRTIKDSVFRDLFSQPEYLLQLYQTLHPEDTAATEADLGNVTIRNIFTEQLYNDPGFYRRVNPTTHAAVLHVAGFI